MRSRASPGYGSRPWRRSWSRCGRRRNSRSWRWRGSSCSRRSSCWCRRRCWDIPRSLDDNTNLRAGFKEAYCCICRVWRLVGIKPEIVQCAKANCVGVLIGRKRFRAPGDRACVLGNIPRYAAKSSISQGAIVWPAGFLRRRVKPQRHAERLNGAIQVLVIERVFVVPNPSVGARHFVAHEPDPVVSRVGLHLVDRCASSCPSHNSRLHSHCATHRCKGEIRSAAHGKLTIGSIVIHVALSGM